MNWFDVLHKSYKSSLWSFVIKHYISYFRHRNTSTEKKSFSGKNLKCIWNLQDLLGNKRWIFIYNWFGFKTLRMIENVTNISYTILSYRLNFKAIKVIHIANLWNEIDSLNNLKFYIQLNLLVTQYKKKGHSQIDVMIIMNVMMRK